jgi:hypothetical protein
MAEHEYIRIFESSTYYEMHYQQNQMTLKDIRNKFSLKKTSSLNSQKSQKAPVTAAVTRMGYEFTVYKGGKDGLVKSTTTKEALKDGEVYLQVTHSGICGTDRFYRGADMVLGHEGVGIVKEIGAGVKTIKV